MDLWFVPSLQSFHAPDSSHLLTEQHTCDLESQAANPTAEDWPPNSQASRGPSALGKTFQNFRCMLLIPVRSHVIRSCKGSSTGMRFSGMAISATPERLSLFA